MLAALTGEFGPGFGSTRYLLWGIDRNENEAYSRCDCYVKMEVWVGRHKAVTAIGKALTLQPGVTI
jgi:hypothetical protein